MYPITTETERLFNEGGNFTERRGGLPNWFEAVCPEDFRQGTSESNPVQAEGVGDTKEGKSTEVSEIDEQAKWLLLINQK